MTNHYKKEMFQKWHGRTRLKQLMSLLAVTSLAPFTSSVKAQNPVLTIESASLKDNTINAITGLSLSGSISDLTIQQGDCFKLSINQPYLKSKELFIQSTGRSDFYVPFPATQSYNVIASQPPGSVSRLDNVTLQIDITEAATDGRFSFEVDQIKNPFSQVQNTELTLKHFVGCQVETACIKNCKAFPVTLYQLPDTSGLEATTSTINPPSPLTENFVATTNGTIEITFKPGPEFPIYGGEITIDVPDWYVGASASESVFNFNPKTICTVANSVVQIDTQQTSNREHTIIYSEYTPASQIVFTCSNYRNPIFAQSIKDFQITVRDRETPTNLVAIYQAWSMPVEKLASREIEAPLKFELYDVSSDSPSENPMPIQTEIGLSIEFNMGSIPIDETGCYVKYTFPNDMPLPSETLRNYLSSYQPGEQMMFSSINGINLKQDQDFFVRNQAFKNGNFIVIKGCSNKGIVGQNQKAKIKFIGVRTPDAAKNTNLFNIEIYKKFDPQNYQFKDKIAYKTGFITEDKLKSGVIDKGDFRGLIKAIQKVKATHIVEFKLKNSLPAKNTEFDSRIVIKMPEKLTIGQNDEPFVKNLDGRVVKVAIAKVTDFEGCTGTIVCYGITHSNIKAIEADSTLAFSITGTTNQQSQQEAGNWEVQTQIQEIATGKFFNIDNGKMTTQWKALAGGIVTSGTPTKSNNYQNYYQPAVYTISFEMQTFIPAGGFLEVVIPQQIKFISSPFAAFQSSNPNLVQTETFTDNSFKLLASQKVDAGLIELSFGGIQNPNSFLPTDLFQVSTTDKDGFAVGSGSLDNIAMREPAPFEQMTITAANKTNGAVTEYAVNFFPTIPLQDGDIFTVGFPSEIVVPRDPICEVDRCLKAIECTGETGKIIVTFKEPCPEKNADVAFVMKGIKNPPSLIPSGKLTASWTNSRYREVAQYSGDILIQNEQLAFFDKNTLSINQLSEDFNINTVYTLVFKPTNAIPRSGWIKVNYPSSISIGDESQFIQNCQALTTQNFKGPQYCNIISQKREIWIYDVFRESETYSSFVTLEFNFNNPETNFFDAYNEEDLAFHITTYAFPPEELRSLQQNNFNSLSVQTFINKMKPDPEQYAKGIDTIEGNEIRPELKCKQPCFSCTDIDPNFCTSCWGPGQDNSNALIFLQAGDGKSTCKAECDAQSSVNGKVIETKDQNGLVDKSKTYYACEDCDFTCNSCQAQKEPGQDGDKIKCITCNPSFRFLIPQQNTCQTTCPGGYYIYKDIEWSPLPDQQSECAMCQEPCTSCRSCDSNLDKNCDASDPLSGAKYCTACDLSKFSPIHVDDVETVEQYIINQASMANKKLLSLSQSQAGYIQQNFDSNTTKIKDFIRTKVYALPDGTQQSDPLTLTGLVVPPPAEIEVNADTTYQQLYQAMYKKYQFPLSSLLEGQCLRYCPDGYASVNGICRPCDSPCKTCRSEVRKCLSCRQDVEEKYLYARSCFEECPVGTVVNEENNECIGCAQGCDICKLDDVNACIKCTYPLLLLNERCYAQCPKGYKQNFWRTQCNVDQQLDVIYIPQLILTAMILVICVCGKYSSKNLSGLHNVFMSFYAISSTVDVLSLWVQLLFTLIQGEFWQVIFPIIALSANYYLNFQYLKLWKVLDPPKPVDSSRLSLKEILIINESDAHFDTWNEKYSQVAWYVKKCVSLWSHKFFSMPYTHFYGYLHLTLRVQNSQQIWEWDLGQWQKWKNKGISNRRMLEANFTFVGKLTERLDNPIDRKRRSKTTKGDDYEGGTLEITPQDFNPLKYVQSPIAQGTEIPDLRVFDLFRKQVKIDLIFIRMVMIIGNIILFAVSFSNQDQNQLHICAIECMVLGFLMIGMQIYILLKWEQLKLPFKMKDVKSNYLFKKRRYPDEARMIEMYLDGNDEQDTDWQKYLPYYDVHEIFLDNKLEELLNIFGKRQTQSCCEFPTGTEVVNDPRQTRSFPMSPRGEELYKGMEGEFNLIHFQLENGLYGDHKEPTTMFQSVARDYSEFGHDPFDYDIMNALNRKGGNLLNPNVDDDEAGRSGAKKKRGRKNRYYRLIDAEDGDEKNRRDNQSDNSQLDNIKEDEENSDDDEDIARKRIELESKRKNAKNEEEDAERLRKQKADQDLKKEKQKQDEIKNKAIEDEKRKKLQEEKDRKAELQKKKDKENRKKEELERQKLAAEQEKKRLAEEERKRKAEEEKAKKDLEMQQKQNEEVATNLQKRPMGSRNQQRTLETMGSVQSLIIRDDALNNFQNQVDNDMIEVPPNGLSRRFNENDILGDLDRDEKGNVLIGNPDQSGALLDRKGRPINPKGYLIDKEGNVINNLNGKLMFSKDELDESGEIPPPFSIEKHGFNPHLIRGHFDHDADGRAIVKLDRMQNIFVDKKGVEMSQRGYRIDNDGNIVDVFGIVKIHSSHVTSDGDLPKLFNYDGRRFDITDCIGQLEKDNKGILFARQDKNGLKFDLLNRRVNTHGYLIDEAGNVIEKDGRIIFLKKHLINEEIPKIFPFSKFNIKTILSDFELDPLGAPILNKHKDGSFTDLRDRKVNQKGYLVDQNGNIINDRGLVVFTTDQLDQEGDIPKVYRTGLLKSNTASSLSRLMSAMGKNQSDAEHKIDNEMAKFKKQGQMSGEDYGTENEDLYGTEDEQFGTVNANVAEPNRKKLKKKKKKVFKKKAFDQWEDASLREHLLAGAYGGIAKPKPKRQGLKYTTDIDAGLRDIATPQIFRETNVSGTGRKFYKANYLNSNSGGEDDGNSSGGPPSRQKSKRKNKNKSGSRASRSNLRSQMQSMESRLIDPQQKKNEILLQENYNGMSKKDIAIAAAKRRARIAAGEPLEDDDFEKLFGQDIEQFLDDSEWEIESVGIEADKEVSHVSNKPSIRSNLQFNKLKSLESNYLPRVDSQGGKYNVASLTPLQANGEKVLQKNNSNLVVKSNATVSNSSLPRANIVPKFRGTGDVYQDKRNENNNSITQKKLKNAWDSQSRNSQKQLTGSSTSKVFKAHK